MHTLNEDSEVKQYRYKTRYVKVFIHNFIGDRDILTIHDIVCNLPKFIENITEPH